MVRLKFNAVLKDQEQPVSKIDSNAIKTQRFDCQTEISALLKKIHSKTAPLSQCIAEALSIGIALKNSELIEFCKNELEGYRKQIDFMDSEAWGLR